MKKRIASIVVTLCLLFLSGCATTARMYNLDTGEVINATFENHGTGYGKITAQSQTGQSFVGEYSTISGASYSSGVGTATVSGSGGYAWAAAQGFSFNQPGQQYGSATIVGNKIVVDIVYVVDPWTSHGYGVGKDNLGKKYKIQF